MKKDLQQNKKSDALKWIATFLAFILLALAVTAEITKGFKNWNPYGWFDKKAEQLANTNKPENGGGEINNGGSEIDTEAGINQGMKLAAVKLTSNEYDSYGVSPLAETAYTLTATLMPDDALDKSVDWTIAFKNSESNWAKGKTVTDYVTITPTADGALTAVVENIKEFGEQIVVKAISRDNTNAYATCNIEYLQRTLRYVFVAAQVGNHGSPLCQIGADGDSSAEIKLDFSYDRIIQPYLDVRKSSVYTRENNDDATYYTLKPTADFLDSLKAIKTVTPAPKSFEGGLTDISGHLCEPIEFFSKSWGEAIYGTTSAASVARNQLIRILKEDYGHYNNFNAYEVTLYDKKGGKELAKYGIHFDTSTVENQFRVESVAMDETEILF